MITRVPSDVIASPNGEYKKMNCPKMIYHPQENKWEVEGGTTEDNAKFNTLRDNGFKEKLKGAPRLEVDDWQDKYREYVDGRLIGDMPDNCYFAGHKDEEINAISNQISDILMKYYQGESEFEDVSEAFNNIVFQMKDLLYERCLSNGNNPSDNKKIIQDTLFEFRRNAVALSVKACHEEGVAKYGSLMSNGGTYYNSKYHDLSENMLSGMEKWATDLADVIPCDPINVNEWRDGPTTCKYLYTSFNERWNATYGLNNHSSEMADFNTEPPENFSFFFQRDGDEATVILDWEGGSSKIKVPFDISKGKDKYNLSDLFQIQSPENDYENRINKFLSNFTIYTAYGYRNAQKRMRFNMSV